MKINVKHNYGVINFIQAGEETKEGFSGIFVYRGIIGHIKNGESVKDEEMEKTLKEDEDFKTLIDNIKKELAESGISFNKKIKRFVVLDNEKFEARKMVTFSDDYSVKMLNGNTKLKKEDKIKLIKEDVIFLLSEVTSLLEMHKHLDEKDQEAFTKALNLTAS